MIVNGLGRDGDTFEADVCVVGAGAAGLTLAVDLARQGISVVLVESGGLEFKWRSHRLLDMGVSGRGDARLVSGTRERFFGGTTNHWGGVCRVFDPFEFASHAWVPYSGWPIDRRELDPYYVEAASILGLPEVERLYDPEKLGVDKLPRLVSETESALDTVIWRRAADDRLRMGPFNLEEVRVSPLITCVLNTTIAELHPDPSGERILSLEGRSFDKGVIKFRASDYALCTGAIENARLMLASDSVVPGGIGNNYDTVGRYFMDHGGRLLGHLLTNPGFGPSQEEFLSGNELIGWSNTPQIREELGLLGFMAFLFRPPDEIPNESAMSGLLGARQKRLGDIPQHRRKSILMNMERSPNPENRVLLSSNRDDLGIRKPLLQINADPKDLLSARKSAELLSLAVARSGLGRVRLEPLSDPLEKGGGHQMGSTRMSDNPRYGVTDRDGRVHSVENLFIGGSSLYPTGGWQHPTFTIVALALRMARHLGARAKSSG